MRITELFDHTADIKPRVTDDIYEVEQEVGGRNILFIAMKTGDYDDNQWRIDFAEHQGADFDEPFTNALTGKGNEFEVFSFVIACAKAFVAAKNPAVIELRSEKDAPARAKLYARLAAKFGKGFDISKKTTSRHDITVLTARLSRR